MQQHSKVRASHEKCAQGCALLEHQVTNDRTNSTLSLISAITDDRTNKQKKGANRRHAPGECDARAASCGRDIHGETVQAF